MECDARQAQDVLLSSVESSSSEGKYMLSARLHALQEATSDLCWITTCNGHMLAEQTSWERFTGQNQVQAAGKGWLEAVHPDDRKLLEITQAQCVQTRRPCNSVCLVQDVEGRYKCLSIRSVPVFNEEGYVREVMCLGTSLMPGQQNINKWLNWTGMVHLQALLIDMAHDIIVVSDQSGRILAWNQGAINIYGYSEQEALGRRGPDLFQTHFPKSLSEEEFVQTLLRDGKWEGELEHVCRDGHRVIVEARFVVMRSEDGQPLAVLEVSRDITERKRTEQQLQEYIQLVEAAGKIGLWTADLVQNKSDILLFDETIFPVQPDHYPCSYEQFLQIVHPDDRAKVDEAHRNALQQKRNCVAEFRVIDAEQRIHWYTAHGRVIYDELGKPVRMIGITLNITERKHMEEELRKSEIRFRRLVEANVCAVVIADSQGRTIEANDFALKQIGYTREEMERGEINWREFTPAEYSQADQHAIQQFREIGVCRPYEKEIFNRQGKRVPLLIAGATIEDDGDVQKHIVFAVDLTRQKDLEKQREHFLHLASHELRTPLTAINGSLQLGRRRLLRMKQSVTQLSAGSEEVFHKVEEILLQSLHQTQVLNRLIDDLVESARITSEKLSLSLEPHNVVEIVRTTVEDMRFTVPKRNILLEDMPQEALVLVDAGRISQVLANLIANALKYSPQEKPIAVGVTLCEQEVRVWVRDWGAGLSSEDQQRVWQRYFQGKGAQDHDVKSVNLGLGLHLCRLLIQQQNGRVGVESQLGEGSTFWFTLPLHFPNA